MRFFILVAMAAHGELSSTGYVLANLGSKYLVYQPSAEAVTVNLAGGRYS